VWTVPVFDYKCTNCGSREEHVLLGSEAAPVACGSCGGDLKRAYGGGRIHVTLEGWGFSKTDSLIADTRGKDFKRLRERAERLVDE
jgi:putative FmdB family regulatory protein